MDAMHTLWMIDSTLRDGEQAPGVAFSAGEKIRLAQMLDVIGIDEIEAGIPAMGKDERHTIRQIVRLNLDARISVWCRALKQDIEHAAGTEAQGIHLAFPVSDIQLATMNKDWNWVKDTLPRMVEFARSFFPYVSVGAQDASRCGSDRLFEFIGIAGEQDISRVRIADTVGILTPVSTMQLIQDIKKLYPDLDIDFHGHNDFGMATANAVTAWQAGASTLSATVNGLGERAGNSALEEVLMTLAQICKQNRYRTSSLFSLCRFVSMISGRPIPEGKAICGGMAFSHESGIHTRASLSDVVAFQPFDGMLVGRESSRNLFGKHSGKGAVVHFLKKQNIQVDEPELSLLMNKIHQIAQKNKRNVYPLEIMMACDHLLHAAD